MGRKANEKWRARFGPDWKARRGTLKAARRHVVTLQEAEAFAGVMIAVTSAFGGNPRCYSLARMTRVARRRFTTRAKVKLNEAARARAMGLPCPLLSP